VRAGTRDCLGFPWVSQLRKGEVRYSMLLAVSINIQYFISNIMLSLTRVRSVLGAVNDIAGL